MIIIILRPRFFFFWCLFYFQFIPPNPTATLSFNTILHHRDVNSVRLSIGKGTLIRVPFTRPKSRLKEAIKLTGEQTLAKCENSLISELFSHIGQFASYFEIILAFLVIWIISNDGNKMSNYNHWHWEIGLKTTRFERVKPICYIIDTFESIC